MDLVILNFFNNFIGRIFFVEELISWVKFVLKYDFILINDECYSEIYENMLFFLFLEVCMFIGNEVFKNVLVIYLFFKCFSVLGLRSGFIVGDSCILEKYKVFCIYLGYMSVNVI